MTTTTRVMTALVVRAGGALYRRAPASLAPAVRRGLVAAARVGLRRPFALVFAGFAPAPLPQPRVVAGRGAESGRRGLVAAPLPALAGLAAARLRAGRAGAPKGRLTALGGRGTQRRRSAATRGRRAPDERHEG